ncbi:MAG: type II secretion system F family protein, partial [Kiritimatiellae bacterium]|nr:type II secretion system F family protein [Kiritimatiellia bacterium]
DAFTSFAAAVTHGIEVGASIVETMKIQGEEMRRVRFNIAERKAARAASAMILPIAIFIMPAFFIVIGVPVYLKVCSSGLGGIM